MKKPNDQAPDFIDVLKRQAFYFKVAWFSKAVLKLKLANLFGFYAAGYSSKSFNRRRRYWIICMQYLTGLSSTEGIAFVVLFSVVRKTT